MSACATAIETAPAPQVPIAMSSASGLALIWRRSDLRPIGQPVAIGDVALGIVTADRKAFVVALDAATGRTLWRQEMTPSWTIPGEPLSITRLGDDKVAFLRPSLPGVDDARIVVADVQSGKELAVSPEVLVTSPLFVCTNGKDVCAIVATGDRRLDRRFQIRLDVTSDKSLIENDKILRHTRTLDTAGLIDLGDRPGNTLGFLRNGVVQWRTPASAAFPSGFSSDNGWSWQLYPAQQVFVGTIYGERITVDGTPAVELSAGAAVAGISERTGKLLWRDQGSDFHCNLDPRDHPVRCRMHGIELIHDTSPSVQNLDVTVEGFDPATGKTTWSVPVGAAKELTASSRPAIAGIAKVVLDGPSGPIVLDYGVGHVESPKPGATFWCMAGVRFEYATPYWTRRPDSQFRRGGWKYDRPGGDLASICDDRGRPASELPSIEATMATGAQLGDRAVIATAGGFLGFQAPPSQPPPPPSTP